MSRQSTSAVFRRDQPLQWDVTLREDTLKEGIPGWEFFVDKIQLLENFF